VLPGGRPCSLTCHCLSAAGLQGAGHVYQRWLQPLLLEYEPAIDQRLAESRTQLGDFVTSNLGRLLQLVREKGSVLLAQVQQAQLKVGAGTGPEQHVCREDRQMRQFCSSFQLVGFFACL
jgi:hypothetical protein